MARTPRAVEVLMDNVEQQLRRKKMNRTELARRIGKSQPQISQFLNGKRALSLGVLDDLASAFEVPVFELLMNPTDGLEGAGLTDEESAVMAGYREADTRTRRAIATLLELPSDAQKPAAVPDDPAAALSELIIRIAKGERGVSHASPDRRAVPGARNRRAPGRDS